MKPMRALALLVLFALFGGCRALAREGPAFDAMAVLRDSSRSLMERMRAAQTLVQLGPEAKAVEPELLDSLLSQTDLAVDPADPLLKQIFPEDTGAGSGFLRAATARALGSFVPDPRSLPQLISLLQDRDVLVQFQAAYALGSLGPEARSAVPALRQMLRSDDADQTEIATFVLARISPDPEIEPAVPQLIATMQGGNGWVARFNAAVALLKLGREETKARAVVRDEVSLGLMLPLLQDTQPMNRLHLCEALKLAGLPRQDILELLRKTNAEDPDARVRDAAQQALGTLER